MIHYAPFDRTKVRYQLIGKLLAPKTRVGFNALCEFESRPLRRFTSVHRHKEVAITSFEQDDII